MNMFREIVIPNNNEPEFIELASKLGLERIYLLYDFDYYNEENTQRKLKSVKNHKNIYIEIGFLVNQKNINNALKHEKTSNNFSIPQKSQSDFLGQSKLLVAKSSDKDRFFIESKKIKLIYGFEELQRKDYLHQRASGLNHVLCELAKKNNVAIGFSYASLFNKTNQPNSVLMGRMMQNIQLCQKYKLKIIVSSFSQNPYDLRSQHDILSVFKMLGLNQQKVNYEH